MAKIHIKYEKLILFGVFFSIMEKLFALPEIRDYP